MFAAALVHTGRPWRAYWVFPYDFSRGVWMNVRSPLIWDPSAVNTYLIASSLFVFVALLPDIAIVRGDPTRSIPEQPAIERVVRAGIDYQPEELLQAAEPIDPSWRDDPWGRQFAQHWTKRAAARS